MRKIPWKLLLIAFVTLLVVNGALLWVFRWQAAYFALPYLVRPDAAFDAAPAPSAPDYTEPSAWLARPSGEAEARPGAVFFIHPTTWLKGESWNQPPEAFAEDAVLHGTIAPNQLSAFESCCALWAPHYRQATFYAFLTRAADGRKALELAYRDVASAFEVFLEETDPAPFVLAAHSQGSLHGMRLLRERIVGSPAEDRLAVAYLPGYPFPADPDPDPDPDVERDPGGAIEPCDGPVGRCLASWNAVERDAPTMDLFGAGWQPVDGGYRFERLDAVLCVNPLSWRADGGPVPAPDNPGSFRGGFVDGSLDGRVGPAPPLDEGVTGASCDREGILRIRRPTIEVYRKAPLGPGWRHVQEYALFWESIRRDALRRVSALRAALPCRPCGSSDSRRTASATCAPCSSTCPPA